MSQFHKAALLLYRGRLPLQRWNSTAAAIIPPIPARDHRTTVKMDILEDLWKAERKAAAMTAGGDIRIQSKGEKRGRKERRKWEELRTGRVAYSPLYLTYLGCYEPGLTSQWASKAAT